MSILRAFSGTSFIFTFPNKVPEMYAQMKGVADTVTNTLSLHGYLLPQPENMSFRGIRLALFKF
jgi:hypothetical protein